jgi:hypothetical protein
LNRVASAAASPATAEELVKYPAETATHVSKDVFEVAEHGREVLCAGTAATHTLYTRKAKLIVRLPLFLIGKDLVSLSRLLEAFFGTGITRVSIRVISYSDLSVRFFNVLFRGAAFDTEDLVVVALSHC